MNIAVFIKRTTFHKGFGGMETMNKILCEGLVERGHNVTVFSPKLDLDKLFDEENGVNYKFVECSFRSLAGFGYLDKNNWHNRSVDEFKKDSFNLVIGQSSAALGIISKKNVLEVPVISISHGSAAGEYRTLIQSLGGIKDYIKLIPNTLYFLFNFFTRQRAFILKSNKVIAVSEFVKEAIINETYISEERVEVIHNGVDKRKIKQKAYSLKREGMQLLFSSQVIKAKGIGDLLKALNYKKLKDVRLEVLAGGRDLEYYKKVAESMDLSNRVSFPGKLPYEEYLSRISDSDVFVMPSKRIEGFPMAVPEAMFARLPVIGSDLGGTLEGIVEGKTGFIFKSGDIEALVSLISRFKDDANLRQRMGNAGYNKAEHEFGLNAMLNKYEAMFAGVVK